MRTPAPRYDIELDVRLSPEGSDVELRGVSKNISETGALILTDREMPFGTHVHFEFPGFEGTGTVIWTRITQEWEVLIGIHFVSLSRKDRKALLGLMSTAAGSN